jgi:hypothetical protein
MDRDEVHAMLTTFLSEGVEVHNGSGQAVELGDDNNVDVFPHRPNRLESRPVETLTLLGAGNVEVFDYADDNPTFGERVLLTRLPLTFRRRRRVFGTAIPAQPGVDRCSFGHDTFPQITRCVIKIPASVHVSHILAKLGVHSRLQAVAVAHRVGVVGR